MSSPQCTSGRSSSGGYRERHISHDAGKQTGWRPWQPQQAALPGWKPRTKHPDQGSCLHWPPQHTGPGSLLRECRVRLAEPQEHPPLLGETLSQPQRDVPPPAAAQHLHGKGLSLSMCSSTQRRHPFSSLQELQRLGPALAAPTLMGPAGARHG